MELLLGALVSVLAQFYKALVKKWGVMGTNLAIYLVVLLLSILFTLWRTANQGDLFRTLRRGGSSGAIRGGAESG